MLSHKQPFKILSLDNIKFVFPQYYIILSGIHDANNSKVIIGKAFIPILFSNLMILKFPL